MRGGLLLLVGGAGASAGGGAGAGRRYIDGSVGVSSPRFGAN